MEVLSEGLYNNWARKPRLLISLVYFPVATFSITPSRWVPEKETRAANFLLKGPVIEALA